MRPFSRGCERIHLSLYESTDPAGAQDRRCRCLSAPPRLPRTCRSRPETLRSQRSMTYPQHRAAASLPWRLEKRGEGGGGPMVWLWMMRGWRRRVKLNLPGVCERVPTCRTERPGLWGRSLFLQDPPQSSHTHQILSSPILTFTFNMSRLLTVQVQTFTFLIYCKV